MIINNILNFFLNIFNLLLQFLPAADPTITTYINSGVSELNNILLQISWLFPSDIFVLTIKIILGFELLILSIRVSIWILAHLSLGFIKRI